MPLIVTGSIGIDSVEAPTGNVDDVLGGSCVYFAAAASFFGPVRVVGAVGDDFPDNFMSTFKHFNVDTQGLEKRAGSKTFRWRGKYHDDMNNRDTLEVHTNVLAEELPPVPDAYADSEFVFLANTHPAGQIELLEQFLNRKLAVADTMDLWIETERDLLEKLMGEIDGLVMNDSEAIMFTDDTNLVRAADKILEYGLAFVVIKKGEHGCMLRHRDGYALLPAFPTGEVIDPTGAGDSFAGGMMGYLASTGDLTLEGYRRALAYGTIVASFNVESFSLDRLSGINRQSIDDRLSHYRGMMAL